MTRIASLLLLTILCVLVPAIAADDVVKVGDSAEHVRMLLGEPKGAAGSGRLKILFYDDREVELQDGKVVKIVLKTAPVPIPASDKTGLSAPTSSVYAPSSKSVVQSAPVAHTESTELPQWARMFVEERLFPREGALTMLSFYAAMGIRDDAQVELARDMFMRAEDKTGVKQLVRKHGSPDRKETGSSGVGNKKDTKRPVVYHYYGPMAIVSEIDGDTIAALAFSGEFIKEFTKGTDFSEAAARFAQKHQSAAPASERTQPTESLPAFAFGLTGANPVRVRNPNDFSVRVGLRSGGKGKDFTVDAGGTSTAYVPDGAYDIYFVYSDKPNALFQGDSFTLNNNGVEIQIVKVVNGNYGIRQVK